MTEIKGSPDRPTLPNRDIRSDFESQLFRNGTLDFDPQESLNRENKSLETAINWCESNTGLNESAKTEFIAERKEDAERILFWERRFGGQIPRGWDVWTNVRDDFEKARQLGVQLNETLVDAGAMYPHPSVVNKVYEGQRLNIKQLVFLFVGLGITDLSRDKILAAQRKMGVNEDDLLEARKSADEALNNYEKMRSGRLCLRIRRVISEQKSPIKEENSDAVVSFR